MITNLVWKGRIEIGRRRISSTRKYAKYGNECQYNMRLRHGCGLCKVAKGFPDFTDDVITSIYVMSAFDIPGVVVGKPYLPGFILVKVKGHLFRGYNVGRILFYATMGSSALLR